jgi:hypothetical protein
MAQRITTLEVFHLLGITPTNEQAWSVGNRMQAMYAAEFGEQPPKDNRPTTTGAGTHCFALYPASWRGRIERVVREVTDARRSQGDLFTP